MWHGKQRSRQTATLVTVALLSVGARAGVPGSNPWQVLDSKMTVVGAELRITPGRHRLLKLDQVGLDALLKTVLPEGHGYPETILPVPLPGGGFGRFAIQESPILPPPLAKKHPEIRTFVGQGIDDPTATARFGITPHGFHGMVLSASGTFYLEPMYKGDRARIAVYRKQDYRSDKEFSCNAPDQPRKSNPATNAAPGTIVENSLRTYRLALAATAEYTAFHGGTVTDGLSAVVTALNRVDAILEREVAGRMVLVDDNDLLIYTDASTDPYNNNNPFALVFQNQSNLDSVIGEGAYDLGHVVSTNSLGGAAEIASICVAGLKGKATSGQPAPVGDPFYISYLAHELGHQWGANHTFNGCAQRYAPTAYEPGSGSTIMSYAGICGLQNLQTVSDDYFHVASIQEIIQYVTTGDGSVCGTESATGNFAVVADAGPDYTIPAGTAFTLCGDAFGNDLDATTFNWEQFDLGPEGSAVQPVGDAPIFRSFPSTTGRCRTFPRMGDVLNSTRAFGELLPSYARTLHFRMTARDNHAGGGAVTTDQTSVDVSAATGPFRVLLPLGGEAWATGSTRTITWDVAGTDVIPINCDAVSIDASLDGGLSFSETLADAVLNDGEHEVLVPDSASDRVRVRVRCSDNIFFDVSDADLTVFMGGEGGCNLAVFGRLTALRADLGFDEAACLGQFPDGVVIDAALATLPDPPPGESYYVLSRNSCSRETFGTPGQEARLRLDAASPCPI